MLVCLRSLGSCFPPLHPGSHGNKTQFWSCLLLFVPLVCAPVPCRLTDEFVYIWPGPFLVPLLTLVECYRAFLSAVCSGTLFLISFLVYLFMIMNYAHSCNRKITASWTECLTCWSVCVCSLLSFTRLALASSLLSLAWLWNSQADR